MKKQIVLKNSMTELSPTESALIVGGGDITNYLRCVSSTLTSGGGGVRTLMLGVGLFGIARLLGVAVGCSNL